MGLARKGKTMKRIIKLCVLPVILLCALFLCSCVSGRPESAPTAVPLEEAEDLVLFRNDQCVLSLASVEKKHSSGTTLTFKCENLTADRMLNFEAVQYAVNHYVVNSGRAPGTVVFAKSQGEFEIVIGPKYLQEYGVEQEELELYYRISDDKDASAPAIAEGFASVLLQENSPETVTVPEPMHWELEDAVLDDEKARVILYNAESWEALSLSGPNAFSVYGYFENKTDKTLTFAVNSVVMDGQSCPESWTFTLYPKMRAMRTVDFSKDFFAQSGLNSAEIQEISYTLDIYDSQGIGVSPYISRDEVYAPIYPQEMQAQ